VLYIPKAINDSQNHFHNKTEPKWLRLDVKACPSRSKANRPKVDRNWFQERFEDGVTKITSKFN
jgi:hypothetical protein